MSNPENDPAAKLLAEREATLQALSAVQAAKKRLDAHSDRTNTQILDPNDRVAELPAEEKLDAAAKGGDNPSVGRGKHIVTTLEELIGIKPQPQGHGERTQDDMAGEPDLSEWEKVGEVN